MANGHLYSGLSDLGFFPFHRLQWHSWLNYLSAVITSDLITRAQEPRLACGALENIQSQTWLNDLTGIHPSGLIDLRLYGPWQPHIPFYWFYQTLQAALTFIALWNKDLNFICHIIINITYLQVPCFHKIHTHMKFILSL